MSSQPTAAGRMDESMPGIQLLPPEGFHECLRSGFSGGAAHDALVSFERGLHLDALSRDLVAPDRLIVVRAPHLQDVDRSPYLGLDLHVLEHDHAVHDELEAVIRYPRYSRDDLGHLMGKHQRKLISLYVVHERV